MGAPPRTAPAACGWCTTATPIDGDRLTVVARDAAYAVTVELHYRGWADLPLLSKWLVIRNSEDGTLELEQMKSAAWQLPLGWDYRLTHLTGNWGCEYTKNQLMLTQARTVLQNNRITCAAAQQIPFFALDQDGAATAGKRPCVLRRAALERQF